MQRKFAWGLDVSGTLQGAGGVGGLLVIDTGSAQYRPIYDASHMMAAGTGTAVLTAIDSAKFALPSERDKRFIGPFWIGPFTE